MPFDMVSHLTRQFAFSRATFGPGQRTKGALDHIRKEMVEVETATDSLDRKFEWADIAILGLDGLMREIAFANGSNMPSEMVAREAVSIITGKQSRNECRTWPDWRSLSPDHAIEHERSK